MILPYKPLTDEHRGCLLKITSKAARILKQQHKKCSSVSRRTDRSRQTFRGALFTAFDKGQREACGVKIRRSAQTALKKARKVEWVLFCANSGLIKEALRVLRNTETFPHSLDDDLLSTGSLALVDAIYHYTDCNIQFSTFAMKCIKRRMKKEIDEARLIHWPRELRQLLLRVEEARQSRDLPMTLDEVAMHLDLSNDEMESLEKGFAAIVGNANDGEPARYEPVIYEHALAVDRVEMDELEMLELLQVRDGLDEAIIEGAKSGHWGWQSEVAKTFHCSRAWVGQRYRKIIEGTREQIGIA